MAELNTNDNAGRRHRKRRTRLSSTRIDMTPMVDLAFLLLTFFMLSTTFFQPRAMEITNPVKGEPCPVNNALTLLIDDEDKLHWYFGEFKTENELQDVDWSSANGLRKLLLNKKSEKLTVIVKPSAKASYKSVVDVLDELKIADIEHYALVEPAVSELALLSDK